MTRESTTTGPVRADFDVEVRYAETDNMGVVHHSNYLVWFEYARTKLCDALTLLEERFSRPLKPSLRYNDDADTVTVTIDAEFQAALAADICVFSASCAQRVSDGEDVSSLGFRQFFDFLAFMPELGPQNPSPRRKFYIESDFQVQNRQFRRPGAKN